jgi:hypothetical protein
MAFLMVFSYNSTSMKYTIIRFLCFIFFIGFIGSCTITKRFHNPGWHVEWKSSNQKVAKTNIEPNPIFSGGEGAIEEQSTMDPETNTLRAEGNVNALIQPSTMFEKVVGDKVNSEDYVLLTQQTQSKHQVVKRQSLRIYEDDKVVDQRIEPFGILSLVSFLMALTSIFFGISFGWSLMGLSYVVFFIFGIVSAIISLRRFRNSPDVYRGKRFIKIGLIAFLSVYGVMILLSIVLLIWYIFTGSGITFM